jgi:hypothetical protein
MLNSESGCRDIIFDIFIHALGFYKRALFITSRFAIFLKLEGAWEINCLFCLTCKGQPFYKMWAFHIFLSFNNIFYVRVRCHIFDIFKNIYIGGLIRDHHAPVYRIEMIILNP